MSEIYWIFPFECKHGKPQRELKAKLKPKCVHLHTYTHTQHIMSRDKHTGSACKQCVIKMLRYVCVRWTDGRSMYILHVLVDMGLRIYEERVRLD